MCFLRVFSVLMVWLTLPTAFLGACSAQPATSPRDAADANDTGRVVAPASDSERRLLKELPTLQSGRGRSVGDAKVVAEAPYASASGKTCRAVHVTPSQARDVRHRLACSDGKSWFFVPDVFDGKVLPE